MTTSESSTFDLSWVREIEDYYEAFQANAQARGGRKKSLVILAAGCLIVIAGLYAKQPFAVLSGVMLTLYGNLHTTPMSPRGVRKLWLRFEKMRDLTKCRVVPGEGLIPLSVPGAASFSWKRFDGVLETDRVFVLQMVRMRHGTGFSRLLPAVGILVRAKRGLDSASDVSRLRDLLIQETGGTRTRRG